VQRRKANIGNPLEIRDWKQIGEFRFPFCLHNVSTAGLVNTGA